jgi:hypothetical protein
MQMEFNGCSTNRLDVQRRKAVNEREIARAIVDTKQIAPTVIAIPRNPPSQEAGSRCWRLSSAARSVVDGLLRFTIFFGRSPRVFVIQEKK